MLLFNLKINQTLRKKIAGASWSSFLLKLFATLSIAKQMGKVLQWITRQAGIQMVLNYIISPGAKLPDEPSNEYTQHFSLF